MTKLAHNGNRSIFTNNPEIKERSYTENTTAWAFLTNIPITPGHTLISPKRVVATAGELTDEEIKDIFELVEVVQSALRKTFNAKGFNFAWNEGKEYGQSVLHFHLHVVPRTPNDDGISEYEPRKFLYRPGSREVTPEDELKAVTKQIIKEMDS